MTQPMTYEEAETLAKKREAHKSKHMTQKNWRPVHTEEKGWHVALVDNASLLYQESREKARKALFQGDFEAFKEAASQSLKARVRMALDD